MSDSDGRVAAAAAGFIEAEKPDFAFVYMGTTDETGHNKGWMTEPYLNTVYSAVGHIRDLIEKFGDEYVFIITADHGGHDRRHGTELDEDMEIPVLLRGKPFRPGEISGPVSIMDIAPTVTALLEASPAREWEGKSLL